MLSLRIENPPVPAVPKEVVTASNSGMAAEQQQDDLQNGHAMEISVQVPRALALCAGTSLLTCGPGTPPA